MLDAIFASFLNNAIACDSLAAKKQGLVLTDDKTKVESKICDSFTNDYAQVRLNLLKVTGKQIADEADTKELYQPQVEAPLAGRVKIVWSVKSDNGQLQQLTALYSLEAFKDVAVFSKSIVANQTLSDSDVEVKSINVAPYLGLKQFHQGSPEGMLLLKKVNKGSYVFTDILAGSALIKRNDEIALIITSGALKISTLAIALENGYKVGENIKVRIKETGAIVPANIKFEKKAYVEI